MASIVGFKNIKALEFLIEDRKGLKSLGFHHLRLEPILDFILFNLFEVLVIIVEMSIQL